MNDAEKAELADEIETTLTPAADPDKYLTDGQAEAAGWPRRWARGIAETSRQIGSAKEARTAAVAMADRIAEHEAEQAKALEDGSLIDRIRDRR